MIPRVRALIHCVPLAFVCLACSTESSPEPAPIACDPTTERCPLTHDFGAYQVEAGGEIDGVCMSWTMHNEEELWVNAVATHNDGFFHHSNWFYVPEDAYDVPDGHWNCFDEGFSEVEATLKGGVLYAQSTQTAEEEQRFLPGAAIRVPPRSRIIAYTHLLNPTADPIESEIRVSIETLDPADVTAVLSPFRFNYAALQIPPMSSATFGGSCDMRTLYESLMMRDFEMKLHWVLPHFHSLGTSFTLDIAGGDRDGERIFELDSAYGEPLGHRFAEPLDIAAGGTTGLRFACGYDNPRDAEVGFGIGDQEMCVMLGFAESGFLFDGNVAQTDEVVMDDDGVARGTGPCNMLGVPFQHAPL